MWHSRRMRPTGREAAFDQYAHAVAEPFDRHRVDHVGHEGLAEHCAGLGLGYASGAHVEQGLGIQLSGGRAVGAAHVVAVYLELRAVCILASGEAMRLRLLWYASVSLASSSTRMHPSKEPADWPSSTYLNIWLLRVRVP